MVKTLVTRSDRTSHDADVGEKTANCLIETAPRWYRASPPVAAATAAAAAARRLYCVYHHIMSHDDGPVLGL